jgi:hypothetical protein
MKSPFDEFPLENNYDITAITRGKFTKDVLRKAVEHFDKKDTPIYAVYVPSKRASDICDWVCSDKIPTAVQDAIWKQHDQEIKTSPLCPSIEFFKSNDEYDGAYVFVAGTKNINDYILKDILSFEEAVNEFGKENIIVIKVG